MLTPEQRAALVSHVQSSVARARAAVEGLDWHWWEDDEKAQQLGAINIVATTTLRAMTNLAVEGTETADTKLTGLSRDADQALASIRGYAADATTDQVLRDTVSATAQQVGQLAGEAVDLASDAAGGLLKGLWHALPTPVLVLGGLALAGGALWLLRPVLGLAAAARAK